MASKKDYKPKFIKAVKVYGSTFTTANGAARAWASWATYQHHKRIEPPRDANGYRSNVSPPCCILKTYPVASVTLVGPATGPVPSVPSSITMRVGCLVEERLRRRALKIFKKFFTN